MAIRRRNRRQYGTISERFGGIDTPAAIAGTFTALGVLVLLSSLLAAGAGSIPYQLNLLDIDGNLGGFEPAAYLVALGVVFVSFFVGGWAAGRMALLDGEINGVASAVWMLLLIVVFGAAGAFIGAEYNAFAQAQLPDWVSQLDAGDITLGAGLATIGTIVVMFLAAWLGGRVGELAHDLDRVTIEARSRVTTTAT